MKKAIEKNRVRIDAIDKQVFDLLIDRLDAVTTIGHIKKKEGFPVLDQNLSLIHISEPTRRTPISYAVFCLKKK